MLLEYFITDSTISIHKILLNNTVFKEGRGCISGVHSSKKSTLFQEYPYRIQLYLTNIQRNLKVNPALYFFYMAGEFPRHFAKTDAPLHPIVILFNFTNNLIRVHSRVHQGCIRVHQGCIPLPYSAKCTLLNITYYQLLINIITIRVQWCIPNITLLEIGQFTPVLTPYFYFIWCKNRLKSSFYIIIYLLLINQVIFIITNALTARYTLSFRGKLKRKTGATEFITALNYKLCSKSFLQYTLSILYRSKI